MLHHAKRISQSFDEAIREVSAAALGDSGHVRIGSGPTAAEWLLPGVFASILKATPELTFEIVTGLGNMLRRRLREGELDLVIGPAVESDATEFTVVPLGDDTLCGGGARRAPID